MIWIKWIALLAAGAGLLHGAVAGSLPGLWRARGNAPAAAKANAQYTARQTIAPRFIVFDQGGHTWVGHDAGVMAAIRSAVLKAHRS